MDALPIAAMLTLEFGEIALVTLSKAAMTSGLSSLVYCVYSKSLMPSAPSSLSLFSSSTVDAEAAGDFLSLSLFWLDSSSSAYLDLFGAYLCVFGHQVQLPNSSGGLGEPYFRVYILACSHFQAIVLKEYPEKMTLIFFSCLFGTIQSTAISLIVESNLSAWKLHSGIQIIAILYAAICGTVLRNSIYPWCLEKKGPVFVALFKPMETGIAVVFGMMFLGETPCIGSLIGALVITLGFYAVMWGQTKESDILAGKSCCILEPSTQKSPLSQSTRCK